jgi:hypothetical protein
VTLPGSSHRVRVGAAQAWLDSLPRQAPPEVSQRLIGVFGTRQVRRMAGGSTGSTNPFAGFSGSTTLECLAEELPQEFRLAILRQTLVRRLCVDCVLGRSAPIVAQFVSEVDALMKEDASLLPPHPSEPVLEVSDSR